MVMVGGCTKNTPIYPLNQFFSIIYGREGSSFKIYDLYDLESTFCEGHPLIFIFDFAGGPEGCEND